MFKNIAAVLVSIVLFVALIFGLNALDIAVLKTFMPWREEIKHEVFVSSHQYQESKNQELKILESAKFQLQEDIRMGRGDVAALQSQLRVINAKIQAVQ